MRLKVRYNILRIANGGDPEVLAAGIRRVKVACRKARELAAREALVHKGEWREAIEGTYEVTSARHRALILVEEIR